MRVGTVSRNLNVNKNRTVCSCNALHWIKLGVVKTSQWSTLYTHETSLMLVSPYSALRYVVRWLVLKANGFQDPYHFKSHLHFICVKPCVSLRLGGQSTINGCVHGKWIIASRASVSGQKTEKRKAYVLLTLPKTHLLWICSSDSYKAWSGSSPTACPTSSQQLWHCTTWKEFWTQSTVPGLLPIQRALRDSFLLPDSSSAL